MKTVYFDVDTQFDFILPTGGLYAPGAERILGRVSALNRHAIATGSVLVSTMDAHSEDDPEFQAWPPHCIVGTFGQRKPESTLLASRAVVSSKAGAWLDGGNSALAGQILLEKQNVDCFTNPNLAALLEALDADRYVVYGVVTEICVQYAAFGLLATGKPVDIVEDAIRSLSDERAAETLQGVRERGGRVVSSTSVLAG